MIFAKIKIIETDFSFKLEKEVNDFLKTIDIRQVVKTDYQVVGITGNWKYSVVIYYVQFEDIRDAKIDSVLDLK